MCGSKTICSNSGKIVSIITIKDVNFMFPERLRALRRGQNITLKELANALNVSIGDLTEEV